MVIDACMTRLFGKPFDRHGAIARRGRVMDAIVARTLREPYFSSPPPKSCGREEFGDAFVTRFIARCRKGRASNADIVATATALTAESIADACRRFVMPHLAKRSPQSKTELVVAGGGAGNATLMSMLRDRLAPYGIAVRQMEEFGVSAQAKEAVAFALLAWLTWSGLPGNVTAATGASRGVVLGKVTHA